MSAKKIYRSIGLMSGTSADGIDLAYIESNGSTIHSLGGWMAREFSSEFRNRLKSLNMSPASHDQIERELTLMHQGIVMEFLKSENLDASEIDVIGFHGYTWRHEPSEGRTFQIADGELLANSLVIPVVTDFRSNDLRNGGQGAPFAPIFHSALASQLKKPVAILNIGGVANVTWIGKGEQNILAFDTGPGNAMIDDWIASHNRGSFDRDGLIASSGVKEDSMVSRYLRHNYFQKNPPKSLDRNEFSPSVLHSMSLEDGAATLTAFSVEAMSLAANFFPEPPSSWIVCGGGRHNDFMMSKLQEAFKEPVYNADTLGWVGDAIEAQAFGYLAIRSILGMPLSYPSTTGVQSPQTGGRFYMPTKNLA